MDHAGDAETTRVLSGVRPLWFDDWYDRPLTGIAEFEGEQFWFDAVWDEVRDNWSEPRCLVLRRIPDSELARQWTVHRDFERYVSTRHCRHDGTAEVVQRPEAEWHLFFDHHPPESRPDYSRYPSAGTFIWRG